VKWDQNQKNLNCAIIIWYSRVTFIQLNIDDDYGQKTVSVLVNNQETELEIIDHPACEMSVSWSNHNVIIE
jgi:hypothetical protein